MSETLSVGFVRMRGVITVGPGVGMMPAAEAERWPKIVRFHVTKVRRVIARKPAVHFPIISLIDCRALIRRARVYESTAGPPRGLLKANAPPGDGGATLNAGRLCLNPTDGRKITPSWIFCNPISGNGGAHPASAAEILALAAIPTTPTRDARHHANPRIAHH